MSAGRALVFWRGRLIASARLAFIALLLILVLPKGGVPWPLVEMLLVPFGLLLAIGALEPCRNGALERLRRYVFLFAVALAAYVLFQIVAMPDGLFANPIWSVLSDTLGVAGRNSISVAPSETLWSLPRLLLPFIVFLAAIPLFQNEKDVLLLWKVIAGLGCAYAVYGILQLLLFPSWLLFEEKIHYLDALSGPLVNRNSAATLLGVTLVVTISLIRVEISQRRREASQRTSPYPEAVPLLSRFAMFLIAAAVLEFIALVMTKSRGGLLSSVLASIVLVSLLDFRVLKARLPNRLVVFGVVIILALLALDLFAGRVLYRIETSSVDVSRLCAYQSTWKAALTNMPFGTGLGTFIDVFPIFRNPSCGISGIWDLAHNTYLENFLELGIAYLVFLLIGFAVVLRALVSGMRDRRRYRPFAVGGLAATILVSAHAFVDFSMQIPAVSALYAAVLASAMTVSLGRNR